MSIINKIKWVASILLVFAIVLATNLIDKNNFNQLRHSVTTIYEDRIVASDIIFELTISIQEKEIALAVTDKAFFAERNERVNQVLADLIERYETTKLTGRESDIFDYLKEDLEELKQLEQAYVDSDFTEVEALAENLDRIVHRLHDLSKIQLKEGRRQLLISNRVMEDVNFLTQMEIIFLIVIAVLVQIIILYRPK